ncbi:MAG: glycerol-3-phosphate acyltransferase [Paludibacteraceae bacterium]|nr:glycerol-3-phosphate acyltransferase [Paludibacteraceae bacterium]OPZ01992.1 MAG: putative glycerol-3-phosphate acyltransferase [Bacteroidetes bacterium ADurb.BinA395]
MNQYVLYLVCLVAGYLIGSVLFAQLITKLVFNQNIRELGNGNPGAYNVFRNVSKFWGVLTGLLDTVKALVPMWIAHQFLNISDTATLGCIGIGAVIGHGLPLYYHFKGGRAASTLLGMYAYFIGIELLIALAVDAIVVFGFIKKEYGIWGPSLLIALSGLLCLFFPHEMGVKILVWIGALITLFFNRDKLMEKKGKVTEEVSQQ